MFNNFAIADLPTTLTFTVVALFIGFNFYQIASLIRERLNARLPDADAHLLRQSFEGLTDSQIAIC